MILYILLSHFHQVWIKFGTDVHKTLNGCGFREYGRSDMHTKGLNEFLSVFSTLLSIWPKIDIYDVHVMLLSILKIRENGRCEAHISRA